MADNPGSREGHSARGRTSAHGGEHAQSSAGNAVHVGQGKADVDAHGNDEAGDDSGLVAQSQAEDDVSGSASAAGIRNILHMYTIPKYQQTDI